MFTTVKQSEGVKQCLQSHKGTKGVKRCPQQDIKCLPCKIRKHSYSHAQHDCIDVEIDMK